MLYAHFSESLTGLPTIRSFGQVDRFIEENKFYIDLEDRALLLTTTNQRWLAIRLDALGAILVFFVSCLSSVCCSEKLTTLHRLPSSRLWACVGSIRRRLV